LLKGAWNQTNKAFGKILSVSTQAKNSSSKIEREPAPLCAAEWILSVNAVSRERLTGLRMSKDGLSCPHESCNHL